MKTQIEVIERFNKESSALLSSFKNCGSTDTTANIKLTANVRGLNNVPLLYAAVEIMADKSVLERMLRSGADPRRGQGKDGSPINLARKQYERCREKERDSQSHAQSLRSAEAKTLLDMLLSSSN